MYALRHCKSTVSTLCFGFISPVIPCFLIPCFTTNRDRSLSGNHPTPAQLHHFHEHMPVHTLVEMSELSYYDILEASPSAPLSVIKAAAKALFLECHPDKTLGKPCGLK